MIVHYLIPINSSVIFDRKLYFVLKNLALWAMPVPQYCGIRDNWLCHGVLCLKSQISSTKKQTSSKLQAPKLKEIPKFVILNFGYCDLFVI